MRKEAVSAALGVATLAVPATDAVAAVAKSGAATVAPKKTVVTKKVSGPAAEANRWGTVQITVTVRKTTTVANGTRKVTRKIVDIGGSFSYHTDRSLYIMQQALPQLRQQALQTLSANVDLISGATYTSQAFQQSLQAALLEAKLV